MKTTEFTKKKQLDQTKKNMKNKMFRKASNANPVRKKSQVLQKNIFLTAPLRGGIKKTVFFYF